MSNILKIFFSSGRAFKLNLSSIVVVFFANAGDSLPGERVDAIVHARGV
jgi:hypothetical protein